MKIVKFLDEMMSKYEDNMLVFILFIIVIMGAFASLTGLILKAFA